MVDFVDENDNIDAALLTITRTIEQQPSQNLWTRTPTRETGLFHNSSVPRTPSPTIDRSASYNMDLSLSSESDLEFFDGFPCLGPSSL